MTAAASRSVLAPMARLGGRFRAESKYLVLAQAVASVDPHTSLHDLAPLLKPSTWLTTTANALTGATMTTSNKTHPNSLPVTRHGSRQAGMRVHRKTRRTRSRSVATMRTRGSTTLTTLKSRHRVRILPNNLRSRRTPAGEKDSVYPPPHPREHHPEPKTQSRLREILVRPTRRARQASFLLPRSRTHFPPNLS